MTLYGLSGLQVLGFALACVVGLGILYLLRRPPRELPFSSIFLWEQVLERRKKRAPDYLRRLISWLLASTIALCFVVALGDPELNWLTRGRRQLQIVLYNGPSMLATDAQGVSRWDAALDEVRKLLAAESPSSRVFLQDTGQHSGARRALTPQQAIRQLEDMAVEFSGELRFPEAVAGNDSLLFLTDGGGNLEIPAAARHIPVYTAIDNVRLTSLNLRLHPRREAILKIANLGKRPRDIQISLRDSKGQEREETIPLTADQEATLITSLDDFEAGPIVAELVGLRDGFGLDNSLFAWLPPVRRKILLAGDRSRTLETLLSLYAELEVDFVGKPETIEGGADAVILSNWAPQMPCGVPVLVLGTPDVAWLPRPGAQFAGVEGVHWENDHRLSRGIDLTDLRVTRARKVEIGSARVLAGSQPGSLFLVQAREPAFAQITFRLEDSNLERQPALPILVDNFLGWVFERGIKRAQLGSIELESGSRVWDPRGVELELESAFGGRRALLDRAGIYSAITPEGRVQIIANPEPVLLPSESPRPTGQVAALETAPGVAWWKVLLLLAGVASLGEWVLFHFRLTV